MTSQEFIERYTEYFGESAPLPLAVVYSKYPLGEKQNVPGCMFKQFHRAYFRYRWLTVKWIVGVSIILIGTFGLHPLALEIIAQATATANEFVSFPTDYFGSKLQIVNWTALLQVAGLFFLIWVSVFKP